MSNEDEIKQYWKENNIHPFDDVIPHVELFAKNSDIRCRALVLCRLEIEGKIPDSYLSALCGDYLGEVCEEWERLRAGKSQRIDILHGRFSYECDRYLSLNQRIIKYLDHLSDEFKTAKKKWGDALDHEHLEWTNFLYAAEDAGWMDNGAIPTAPTSPASPAAGTPDASEDWYAELRGIAEGVKKLNADKRKTSKEHERAGRIGGKESARRQRADGERKRILAAALQRMRREIAAVKSIKQAARDAMRKGGPLLKSNGEPLREDSLVRYFKAAKSKGSA